MLACIIFTILNLVLPEVQSLLGVEFRAYSLGEVFVRNFSVFITVKFIKQPIELGFGKTPA
jgi:hypothetical protein